MSWNGILTFLESRKALTGNEILSIFAMAFLVSLLSAIIESIFCINSDWVLEYKRAMLWQLFNTDQSFLIITVLAIETVFSRLALMLFTWVSRSLRWPAAVLLLLLWMGGNVGSNLPHSVKEADSHATLIAHATTPAYSS